MVIGKKQSGMPLIFNIIHAVLLSFINFVVSEKKQEESDGQ
jgi:hypothetical protein